MGEINKTTHYKTITNHTNEYRFHNDKKKPSKKHEFPITPCEIAINSYLIPRNRDGFEALEAVVLENEVPLLRVLQPEPIGPDEIQPTFHFAVSFGGHHHRRSKWNYSQIPEQMIVRAIPLEWRMEVDFNAKKFPQKGWKQRNGECRERFVVDDYGSNDGLEKRNDTLIPTKGTRESMAEKSESRILTEKKVVPLLSQLFGLLFSFFKHAEFWRTRKTITISTITILPF